MLVTLTYLEKYPLNIVDAGQEYDAGNLQSDFFKRFMKSKQQHYSNGHDYL